MAWVGPMSPQAGAHVGHNPPTAEDREQWEKDRQERHARRQELLGQMLAAEPHLRQLELELGERYALILSEWGSCETLIKDLTRQNGEYKARVR